MPRKHLPDRPDALWHVTQRINWQAWHLEKPAEYEVLRDAVTNAAAAFDIDLMAYAVMSNHFHSVVRSPSESHYLRHTTYRTRCRHRKPYPRTHPKSGVVGQYVRRYALETAHRIQNQLGVDGHLWEKKHDRVLIRSPRQLIFTIAYDHRNPVVAKMVSRPEHYPRSSAREWAGLGASEIPILTRDDPVFGLPWAELRQKVLLYQESDRLGAVMREFRGHGLRLDTPRGAELLNDLLDEFGFPAAMSEAAKCGPRVRRRRT